LKIIFSQDQKITKFLSAKLSAFKKNFYLKTNTINKEKLSAANYRQASLSLIIYKPNNLSKIIKG
jgi:hypothetical protein